jgi:hypothetical protein
MTSFWICLLERPVFPETELTDDWDSIVPANKLSRFMRSSLQYFKTHPRELRDEG